MSCEKLSEAQIVQIAADIAEAQGNRAIFTFLEEVWGDVASLESVQFCTIASMGEETIGSCQVFDAQGNLRLPPMDLPFWQEHLLESLTLKADLDACESEDARLGVLNEFLFRGSYFKEDGLPDPKSEHPAFQRKVSLRVIPPSICMREEDFKRQRKPDSFQRCHTRDNGRKPTNRMQDQVPPGPFCWANVPKEG